jgi:hypothetical protein
MAQSLPNAGHADTVEIIPLPLHCKSLEVQIPEEHLASTPSSRLQVLPSSTKVLVGQVAFVPGQ